MLRRLWRNKKTPIVPKERLTITTEERITLEIKASGNQFNFMIGKDENGKFYALTENNIIPKFCFEADSRDEAYTKGVDAINFYLENVLI